jgi:hypothetical protein
MRRLVVGLSAAAGALLLTAGVAHGRDGLPSRWRLSLEGTQTFKWQVGSSFDTAGGGNCTIRHAGDQTIRFSTPGAVPVEVVRADSPTVTSDARANAFVRGKKLKTVPLGGTEARAHRVLELRPNAEACTSDALARKTARDCEATTPLVSTRTWIYFRALRPRPEVEWHIPVDLGFLRTVPSCDVRIFHLRDKFLYPLFTYGRFVPLRGGSLSSPSTRRLTASHRASFCFGERYPAFVTDVPCTRPHAGKVTIVWKMTLTRRA